MAWQHPSQSPKLEGGERGEAWEGGQEAKAALRVTQPQNQTWDSLNLALRPSALH